MRQNALLRSDKRLPNPGTARRKPMAIVASAEERDDHFAMRNGVRCAGVHLIVDLHGARGLDDIDLVEATLRRCVDAARATLLHIHVHHFQPNGISGVAVLAESHISIHTWPDRSYAALDVFMCGKAEPDACIPILREAFQAGRVEVKEILRGQDPR
jgi:S-adenosylmethionine decarboxylase